MTVKVTKPALNVAEKLAELNKPTGVAGEAMLRAETPQEQFNLIGAGRRNVLINGDFQVSQRGDFTSAASATHNGYWLDRWAVSLGTVTANWQQKVNQTVNGIVTNVARVEATSSGTGYIQLLQKVEDITPYLGREVTMSAWVKSNEPVNLYCYNGGAQIGYSENHPADGEWHKLTSTFVLTSTATQMVFYVSTYDKASTSLASGDYFEAALCQLELGKVATPFEHRSYGEELALCQRYYYRVSTADTNGTIATGFATTATGARGVITFPVTMRIAPTGIEHTGAAANYKVAYTFTAATCSAVPSFSNACASSAGVQFTVASGLTAGHGIAIERNSGTAYIGFTGAEL